MMIGNAHDRSGRNDHGHGQGRRQDQESDVHDVLEAVGNGSRGNHFLELACRHEAAGAGQEPQNHLGRDGHHAKPCETAVAQPHVVLRDADQSDRESPERV